MRLKALVITFTLVAGSPGVRAQGSEAVFTTDMERVADARPWTDKEFQNDPDEFQFAVIGDRTGGANVEGKGAQPDEMKSQKK